MNNINDTKQGEGGAMGYEYKKGEIVEGSTKGMARVAPTRYKGDSLIQVWLDSRKIAMLSVWLDSNGVVTRFMSDVIREALDQLCMALVNNGQVVELDTVAARDMLESKYRVNLNPSGRGKRNLINNLVLDDRKPNITTTRADWPICNTNNLDDFGDEGPPIGHPLRAAWRQKVLDTNYENKAQQFEQAKISDEDKRKELEAKYAYLIKPSVVKPIAKPTIEADSISDISTRTSKGASNIPRPKTNEEIQADIDRIKQKDDDLMAALDSIGKPVD